MLALMLGLALPVAPSATATAQTEILSLDIPDEFEMGNHQRDAVVELAEMIAPPETLEKWSRMITVELALGASSRVTVDNFYAGWRNSMGAACAGMAEKNVTGTLDGLRAIKGEVTCPRNPATGLPENVTTVVIQGQANILMAQIAFRRPLTNDDRALVAHVVRSLKVCDQQFMAGCKSRQARGFVAAGQ